MSQTLLLENQTEQRNTLWLKQAFATLGTVSEIRFDGSASVKDTLESPGSGHRTHERVATSCVTFWWRSCHWLHADLAFSWNTFASLCAQTVAIMCNCMLDEYTAGHPMDIRLGMSLTATARKARMTLSHRKLPSA